jgi:hypothetical protein
MKLFTTSILIIVSVATMFAQDTTYRFTNVWNPTGAAGVSVTQYYRDVAVDRTEGFTHSGRVYVTDSKVGSQGVWYWDKSVLDTATVRPAPSGQIATTIPGGLPWNGTASPYGLSVDGDGVVYVYEYGTKKVHAFPQDGVTPAFTLKAANGTDDYVTTKTCRYMRISGKYSDGSLVVYLVWTGGTNGDVFKVYQNSPGVNAFTEQVLFLESNDGDPNYTAMGNASGNQIFISSNGTGTNTKGLVKYVNIGGTWAPAADWPNINQTVHGMNFSDGEGAILLSIPGNRAYRTYSTATGAIIGGGNFGLEGQALAVGSSAIANNKTFYVIGSNGTVSYLEKITINKPLPGTISPIIDGQFDGEEVWGSPVGIANGTVGWAGSNAKKLYVKFDDKYVYFGAEITASNWQAWAFLINTKVGGGSTESWSRNIVYAHTNLPDFIFRGTFGSYSELHAWGGSSWSGVGTSYSISNFGENISGTDQDGWVEGRVLLSSLGDFQLMDVQFYLTGDNNDHATFDACPDDQNTTAWSGVQTTLQNYAGNITVPVELTSFIASTNLNNVIISWTTATEINNNGFELQRSLDGLLFNTIAFIKGNGTSVISSKYSYTDANLTEGKHYYRLKQIDFDGSSNYLGVVEVDIDRIIMKFELSQNYPNPFNPSTSIQFSFESSEYATLKVFNALGEEIETLFNGIPVKGTIHSSIFDASKLSTGIYIYRLQQGNKLISKKMTFLK